LLPEHDVSPAPENVPATLRFVDVAFVMIELVVVEFTTVISAKAFTPMNVLFAYVFGSDDEAVTYAVADVVENEFAR
jgi:hypothetical protein